MNLSRKVYAFLAVTCFFALLLAACSPATPTETSPTETPVPSPVPTSEEKVILTWESNLVLGDQPESTCHRLVVTNLGMAQFGTCNDADPQTANFNTPQLQEMVLRFKSFEYSTDTFQMKFRGDGEISGETWQRSLATWAQSAYTALYTGETCESCNKTLAWELGESATKPEICEFFWVTNYGYAYLGERPCANSGQSAVIEQGWLEPEEWEPLDALIRTRGEWRSDEKVETYLLGTGNDPVSQPETEMMERIVVNAAERIRAGMIIK